MVIFTFQSFELVIAPAVTTMPLSLAPIKCRTKTFWYQLTQLVLENGY